MRKDFSVHDLYRSVFRQQLLDAFPKSLRAGTGTSGTSTRMLEALAWIGESPSEDFTLVLKAAGIDPIKAHALLVRQLKKPRDEREEFGRAIRSQEFQWV